MTLTQDVRTVQEWFRTAHRRTASRSEAGAVAIKEWARSAVPSALNATRGHDLCPDTGVCLCGKSPEGQSYREHLLSVLDAASFLRVPHYVNGEGW